jgi:hypothetical protein
LRNNWQTLTAWLLRLAGSVEILAFGAVVMPRSWMEASHVWLGLGEMPGGPIIMFMIRQASFFYGMHGVLLWLLASDVVRFRPLIIFTGVSYLLAAPIFFIIDITSEMPLWWTVVDSVGCAFLGTALLSSQSRRIQAR